MTNEDTLDCAICGIQVEWNGCPGMTNNPCATVFNAFGNYGSTMFDPMDGSYLEINICDECLKILKQQHLVLHGNSTKKIEKKVEIWQ